MESRKLHSERACLVAPCQFELLRCGELQPFPISSKEKSCYRLLKSTVRPLLNLFHPSNLARQAEKRTPKMPNQADQRTGASRFAQRQIEHHRRLAPFADRCVMAADTD